MERCTTGTLLMHVGDYVPQGWHVPTDAEWHELILQVDPNAVLNATESRIAGAIMRETGTTHWASPELKRHQLNCIAA